MKSKLNKKFKKYKKLMSHKNKENKQYLKMQKEYLRRAKEESFQMHIKMKIQQEAQALQEYFFEE